MSGENKQLKNTDGISDADLKSLARTLFPALREYLSSEQGQRDYAEWKRSQLNNSIKENILLHS